MHMHVGWSGASVAFLLLIALATGVVIGNSLAAHENLYGSWRDILRQVVDALQAVP